MAAVGGGGVAVACENKSETGNGQTRRERTKGGSRVESQVHQSEDSSAYLNEHTQS